MQQALIYSLRIWLTSVFLPPIISNLILILLPYRDSFSDLIEFFFIQLIVSGLLSFLQLSCPVYFHLSVYKAGL